MMTSRFSTTPTYGVTAPVGTIENVLLFMTASSFKTTFALWQEYLYNYRNEDYTKFPSACNKLEYFLVCVILEWRV